MPQIKLKAKLQAYSKVPFYGDYIRDPQATVPQYSDDAIYVLKSGEWVDLAAATSDAGLSINLLKELIDLVASELNADLKTISCRVDNINKLLIFIDSAGLEHIYVLPSCSVDNTSIGFTDLGQLKTLDQPDNKSIKITNISYEEDDLLGILKKKSGTFRADALYSLADPSLSLIGSDREDFLNNYISGYTIKLRLIKAEKSISDLEQYTQGIGGFLDPYRFFPDVDLKYNEYLQPLESLSENLRNSVLTKYALDLFILSSDFKPQTKVKDLYDNSIWVWNGSTWINEGKDTIVNATNTGILGAVTGVQYDSNNPDTKFKISIGVDSYGISTGIMSVNGLLEEFAKVVYKNSEDDDDNSTASGSYVKRTDSGTIVANASINDNDVINQGQFNTWVAESVISDSDITSIVDEYYVLIQNAGGKT